MRHVQLCINGKWCDGDGTFTSFDPSTGANLAIVSKANDDDIRRAITAARGSLAAWRGRSIGERAAILERVVARLRKAMASQADLRRSSSCYATRSR